MQTRFVLCAGLVAGLLNQAGAGTGPAPDWLWAQRLAGPSMHGYSGRAVDTDRTGNVYVTGGDPDLFVAKMRPDGTPLWVRHSGGPDSYAVGQAVAADSTGNVYVAGVFTGQLDFGPTNLNSGYFTWADAFLVKYDSAGNFQWAWGSRSGESSTAYASAIAVAPDDTVVVTGSFWPFVAFGDWDGGPIGLEGSGDVFLARFDGGGSVMWYQRIGGFDTYHWHDAYGLAFDRSGNLYVTGAISHGASFGTPGEGAATILESGGSSDIFVAKYTLNGQFLWVRQAGCPSDGPDESDHYDFGHSIAVDWDGNAYVTGAFAAPGASFGSTNLAAGVPHDFFLAKYDAEGTLLWVRKSDDLALAGSCVRLDAAGGVYVTRTSSAESVVQKYDNAGILLWSQGAGAGSRLEASGVAVAPDGSLYVTGQFWNLLTLGDTSFTNSGNRELFIGRLGSSLPQMAITASAGNVTLAWPIAAGDFQPQFANTLTSPAWQPLAETVATNGALRTVTLPASGASQFYRLWNPNP